MNANQIVFTVVCGAAFATTTALIGLLLNQSAINSLRNDIKAGIATKQKTAITIG